MKIIKRHNETMCVSLVLFFLLMCGCSSIFTASNKQDSLLRRERSKRRIKIGMTMGQVRQNWGMPDSVIKEQDKNYDEIWIYIPNWKFKNYLYFKNGILVKGKPNPEDVV